MTAKNAFFVNFDNIATDHLGQKNQLETKVSPNICIKEETFLKMRSSFTKK